MRTEEFISKKLVRFLREEHKMSVDDVRGDVSVVSYKGNMKSFLAANIRQNELSWLHEMCHFIVASNLRRAVDDFGLALPQHAPKTLSRRASWEEETRVLLLEGCIAKTFGKLPTIYRISKTKLVLPWYHEHGQDHEAFPYTQEDEDRTLRSVAWLMNKGLLTQNYEYTWRVNSTSR